MVLTIKRTKIRCYQIHEQCKLYNSEYIVWKTAEGKNTKGDRWTKEY